MEIPIPTMEIPIPNSPIETNGVSSDSMSNSSSLDSLIQRKHLINDELSSLIKKGMVYESPHHLKESLDHFAQEHSFSVKRHAYQIACRRGGLPQLKADKRKCHSIKCGCTFHVKFSYLDIIRTLDRPPGKEKDNNLRKSDRIKITSVNGMHCDACQLDHDELKVVLKRSKQLSKFENGQIATVVNMVMNDPKLPPSSIRHALKPFFPPGWYLTPTDVVNFRIWCNKHAGRLQEQGASVNFDPASIHTTIKSWRNGNLSVSMTEAGSTLQGVLSNLLADRSQMWVVSTYLSKLKEKDPGFDYKISTDKNGHATGIVWQTPFMRGNFKRFGEVLFLDACKRKLNHLHWPYLAPVVIDGDKHIQVVCESICCGELVDSYLFVLDSLFKMSHHVRKKEDVKTLFSDKFLNRQNIHTLFSGLNINGTCRLFWDQYHILSTNWPETFGRLWCGDFIQHMTAMIKTFSRHQFDAHVAAARAILQGNPMLLDKLNDWVNDKCFWAKFKMMKWECTLMRSGSSHAEQNHSSLLSFMGTLYEAPEKEIKFCLDRNQQHCAAMQQRLSVKMLEIQSEVARLNGQPLSADLVAKQHLHDWAAEQFMIEYKKAQTLCKRSLPNGDFEVWSPETPEAIWIVPSQGHCQCSTKKHLLQQCCHHLCMNGMQIDLSQYADRWIRESRVLLCNRAPDISPSNIALEQHTGNEGDHMEENEVFPCTVETQDTIETFQRGRQPGNITWSALDGLAKQMTTLAVQCKKEKEVYGMVAMVIEAMKGDITLVDATLEEACFQMHNAFGLNKSPAPQNSQVEAELSPMLMDEGSQPPLYSPEYTQHDHAKILPPVVVPQLKRGPTTRIVPMVDRRRKKKKTNTNCGFCSAHGHNRSKCSVLKSMGMHVIGSEQRKALLDNMKATTSLLDMTGKVPKRSLPKHGVQSLLFHGSSRANNGEVFAMVSLFLTGNTRHPLFPEEEEPHPLSQDSFCRWLFDSCDKRNTFVKDPMHLVYYYDSGKTL